MNKSLLRYQQDHIAKKKNFFFSNNIISMKSQKSNIWQSSKLINKCLTKKINSHPSEKLKARVLDISLKNKLFQKEFKHILDNSGASVPKS